MNWKYWTVLLQVNESKKVYTRRQIRVYCTKFSSNHILLGWACFWASIMSFDVPLHKNGNHFVLGAFFSKLIVHCCNSSQLQLQWRLMRIAVINLTTMNFVINKMCFKFNFLNRFTYKVCHKPDPIIANIHRLKPLIFGIVFRSIPA